MYRLVADRSGNVSTVCRTADNAFIPIELRNADCVAFLIAWRDGAAVANDDGTSAAYADWVSAGNPAAPA